MKIKTSMLNLLSKIGLLYSKKENVCFSVKKEIKSEEMKPRIKVGKEKCRAAAAQAKAKYNGRISIDIETTGLDHPGQEVDDEILQISIVDEEGKTLFDSYIKPYAHDTWPEAQRVNEITPEMVSSAPFLHEVAAEIKGYMMGASEIIGYNLIYFDIPFIEKWLGKIEFTGKIADVMLQFAPIFGEWSEKYCNYKYQKLTTCAKYYGVQFNAHNSLEDAKATLKCYKAIGAHKEDKKVG